MEKILNYRNARLAKWTGPYVAGDYCGRCFFTQFDEKLSKISLILVRHYNEKNTSIDGGQSQDTVVSAKSDLTNKQYKVKEEIHQALIAKKLSNYEAPHLDELFTKHAPPGIHRDKYTS